MAPPPPAVRGLLFAAWFRAPAGEWRSRALVGDFRAKGVTSYRLSGERRSLYPERQRSTPQIYTPQTQHEKRDVRGLSACTPRAHP